MSWNRKLNRRTVLRAGTTALALPFLHAMLPPLATAQSGGVRRMLNICCTLGLYTPSWLPQQRGTDYEATEYLRIIDRHRARYTVISGLSHKDQSGRQPHNSEITWLTGQRNPGMDGFKNTVSVDQVAANHLGYVTRYPSLTLGSLKAQSQSYTPNGVMVPAETSPASLFRALFVQGRPEEVAREMQRLADGASILDHLGDQRGALRRSVGPEDRHTLNEYFEAVRGAEREIGERQGWVERHKPDVSAEEPVDISSGNDLIGRVKLFFDLIPLIFATDSTRVINVMLQDHSLVLDVPGTSQDQHGLSHHGREPGKIRQLRIIERAIMEIFGELLDGLRAGAEGSGNLLGRTSVLFGSNLGNANAHTAYDLPILVAGGGFRHGSHVHAGRQGNAPLSNLLLSLLHRMGVPADSFGPSDGTITW